METQLRKRLPGTSPDRLTTASRYSPRKRTLPSCSRFTFSRKRMYSRRGSPARSPRVAAALISGPKLSSMKSRRR
jgi:hypothetical protein